MVVGDVVVPVGDDDVRQGRTERDGTFIVDDVPAGRRAVYVLGRAFEKAFVVDVVAGETTLIGPEECG